MEKKILGYVDGRLKESERLEIEKHLSTCAACRVRVNEFRAVNVLLGELPMIEPSAAFDIRMQARVAAEPAKQSWWAWFAPSPRVVLAASMLLLATMWIGSRTDIRMNTVDIDKINQNMSVLENYDVISEFAPLSDLSQQSPDDDPSDSNQSQQM